jgi:hypothetical protein
MLYPAHDCRQDVAADVSRRTLSALEMAHFPVLNFPVFSFCLVTALRRWEI